MSNREEVENKPNVSIIVPVYNAEKYISECIESILNQSYKNFELIMVNDGSTDKCGMICNQYENFDKRVRVIHQPNQGQSRARNLGVELARGKWISFVDGDDIIHPQMLELMIDAIEKSNAKMCICGAVESHEIPNEFFEKKTSKWKLSYVNQDFFQKLYKNGEHRYWVVCAKLIDKKILMKYPFAEGRIYEDNAVVCRWLDEAHTVVDIEEKMYFYRINPSGTTKSKFNLKKLDYLWALEEQINFYSKKQFYEMLHMILEQYIDAVMNFYCILKMESNNLKYVKRIKEKFLKVLYENRKFISIPNEKKKYIMQVFHPRIMNIYWHVKVGYDIFKNAGFKELIFKCIKFIRKRI